VKDASPPADQIPEPASKPVAPKVPKEPRKARRVTEPAKLKPLTIHLSEGLLKKLKVAAVLKGVSVSSLVETYATAELKSDLKKLAMQLD
jgi:hypothetical protein